MENDKVFENPRILTPFFMMFFHPLRFYNQHLSFLDRVIPDFFIVSRFANIISPKTFDDKVNWMKVFDRKPFYHKLVDKFEVKGIVNSITKDFEWGGAFPTLGVYDCFDEIDFDALPNKFVLKCTHDSGSIVICKDKSDFDISEARSSLTKAQSVDYSRSHRMVEWVYRGIKPRIIAEPLMLDSNGDYLSDYKFYCFNGEPKYIWYVFDRFTEVKSNLYDLNWNFIPVDHIYKREKRNVPPPEHLEQMISISKRIAGFVNSPFLRVDLYLINSLVYFGEVTFYPNGGLGKFDPPEWNLKLGQQIDLRHGRIISNHPNPK